MNKKLWFLTKMSLKKKIKTKWFVIANVLFMILMTTGTEEMLMDRKKRGYVPMIRIIGTTLFTFIILYAISLLGDGGFIII